MKRILNSDSLKEEIATKKRKSETANSNCSKVIESPYFAKTKKLSDDFFKVPCEELAQRLLGQVLCKEDNGEITKGKVVETEAYLGVEDEASHTYKGKKTLRNEAMFLKPGTAYVYINRGIYNCFNVTSDGYASAVLIRALEPLEGIEIMRTRRLRFRNNRKEKLEDKLLCNGPAKLSIAMNIEKQTVNKVDLTTSTVIWFEEGESIPKSDIVSTQRVGINVSENWKMKPLRFFIKDNQCVSVCDNKA